MLASNEMVFFEVFDVSVVVQANVSLIPLSLLSILAD
jgi:hypothetical protein